MEYLLHVFVICGIYSILTLSLNLVVGYTGLVSLGHAAFFSIGAYISALLALNLGISPWIGLIAGACGAAVFGVVIGMPSLRLKGDYLALATFGAGMIVYSISKNWVSLTRGPMGLPGIPGFSVFGFSLDSTWLYLILVIVFTLVTVGHEARVSNYQVFVVGAFFAGIAGSLYAHYITFIDPSSFTVMESITILLMVIFGGMGSIKGSLVGAIMLVMFPEMLRFLGMPSSVAAPMRQMIYGGRLVSS